MALAETTASAQAVAAPAEVAIASAEAKTTPTEVANSFCRSYDSPSKSYRSSNRLTYVLK